MNSKPHPCCPACADGHEQNAQDPHRQLATEQAALHQANLALARWRAGNTPVELSVAATLAPRQTQWHAKTQRNFCAWLEAGGFAASVPERAENLAVLSDLVVLSDLAVLPDAAAAATTPPPKAAQRKPVPPELSCVNGA
ncbi:hypothetical protein ACFOLJ_16310 [Rugamonas sp. CCM 8940]|uniref:hypothetical protein n=1 Tax=Rugamonas sp. CCM 8940 TaxID=2765359 RepID=UPI0018F65917|nr:hypothetical protein [Rugamonas sp. CCM 8940]MBJ7309144.1 hypothetical protein [Rugamonas sp. CCM 8940]